MKRTLSKTAHFLTPVLATLLAAGPTVADDTEIFTGAAFADTQPNVLFILDTSGSMDNLVEASANYDPAVTYDGDCPADRVYWSTSAYDVPSCSSNYWFNASALKCDAALAGFSAEGRYRDRIARYNPSSNTYYRRWYNLRTDRKSHMVDCKADHGIHGDGVDATKLWAAERAYGPYQASSGAPRVLDWDNERRYTLYSSNFVNFSESPAAQPKTRLQVMKEVIANVLNNSTGINVGVMRFSRGGNGGMVVVPMTPIEDGGREASISAVNSFWHEGNTPLSESLYEAVRYYRGMTPYFGLDTYGNNYVAQPSVASSMANGKYISPIVDQCQQNFIVLLTDGDPVSDYQADTATANLTGFEAATGRESCSGNCLDELAGYLRNHDLNDDLYEDQVVDTYTIGFATDQQLLQDTADAGNGEYYTADNADSLTEAFANILDDIQSKDASFTSPALAVNSFNRLNHLNDLYFTVFTPSTRPHWSGNLKRYRLDRLDGETRILDVNNAEAVDPLTGAFAEDSQSYWTLGGPDGFDAAAGGFASRLLTDRRVYTNATGATNKVNLSAAANRLHEDNPLITAELLGVAGDDRLDVIRWARGVDSEDQPLNILGDAMHSKPTIVSFGGTEENRDLTLFYTTNDGYLHAVNPNAGNAEELEVFSFVPYDLLGNLKYLVTNERRDPPKMYGLDGQMTYWIDGDDGDGIVESGEKPMLYFGTRRGGNSYYAMDVSNRSAPKLAWKIQGGTGDFAELGESWSEMSLAKVKINGQAKDVLIFGGGYDADQDEAGISRDDDIGRAIYMVDARTGERLWWAANATDHTSANLALADMTNSIPSNLRVIDMNSDGYDDRFYVGDMGARVWRFDIDNYGNTGAADLVSGGVIADLGGDGPANNRRFYYAPSVSLVSDEWHGNFLAVSIGSGHRANPLGTTGKFVDDRFYMLKDPYVYAPLRDSETQEPIYSSIGEVDLLDVTATLEPEVDDLNGKSGWMIRRSGNEKVLAPALTADGRIFFNTYTPEASVGTLSCETRSVAGTALNYAVSIVTGSPRQNPPGDPDCGGRCEETVGPIPPEPVLVFLEPEEDDDGGGGDGGGGGGDGDGGDEECDGIADVRMVIGTELRNPSICTSPIRTYWLADDTE